MISPHLLTINASYSYRTYSGCLEGVPSPAVMIAAAKDQSENLFGKRPILVINSPVKNKLLPS